MKMAACSKDAGINMSGDDGPQCCIVCQEVITTSTSDVDKKTAKVSQSKSSTTSSSLPSPGNDQDGQAISENRPVRLLLSGILLPLKRPVPEGDTLCHMCCQLVYQVDQLRMQADTLEARLLARLDRGQARVTTARSATVAQRGRGRPPRVIRVIRDLGRPPPTSEAPAESQNYIAPAPPPADKREVTPSSVARTSRGRSVLIKIELCKDGSKVLKVTPKNDSIVTQGATKNGANETQEAREKRKLKVRVTGQTETSDMGTTKVSSGAVEPDLPDADDPGEATADDDPDQLDIADDENELDVAGDGSLATAVSPAVVPAAPLPPSPPEDPPPTYIREEELSQCGVCDMKLETRADCREHMTQAHRAKKVYFCPLCPEALTARNALESHELSTHADSPIKPYGCGQCPETFPTPRFLRRHKEEEHSNVHLPCKFCRRTFRRREDLQKHQHVHSGIRPYICDKCGKGFTKQVVWRKHMLTHSSRRERPHQCQLCLKPFLTAHHLDVHSRRHSREPLRCDRCERTFTSSVWLQKHAETCSTTNFHCDICGRQFGKKSILTAHLRSHTGEKPFLCEDCGAGFSQRSNMITHINDVHRNLKLHQCPVCEKAFARRGILKNHLASAHSEDGEQRLRGQKRSHPPKRSFTCPECGVEFLRRAQLKAHMKRENHRASSEDDDPQPTLEETQLTVAEEDGETTVMEEDTREDGTRAEESRMQEMRVEEEEQQTAEGKQMKATETDQSPMAVVARTRSYSTDVVPLVVETVMTDDSDIYEPGELTVSQSPPPGETSDS